MIQQCTIKNVIRATGVGAHTGKQVLITLRPAPINTGIVFRRVDLNPIVELPALTANIGDTTLSSCLIKDNIRVSTIEHLMAAFVGNGIDNIYVDINGPEVPIMDGSAWPFVFLLQSAGVEIQTSVKKFAKIKRSIVVQDGDRWAAIEPYDGFKVTFTIDFAHPVFKQLPHTATIDFSYASFVKEISRARTFGLLADYEWLRSKQLALGCSLDNVLVIGDGAVINQDGLRYQDEFVKHKILDAVGDLYLLGYNLIGYFSGYKSGHALNNKLLQALLATPDAWELVTYSDIANVPFYNGLSYAPALAAL